MISKSKVLVTGANGLLGTNTVLDLIKQGFLVRAFIRHKRHISRFNHSNVEFCIGNIVNIETLERAMLGCQYVIHIAALIDPKHLDYDEFELVNVTGTKNVIQVAKNLGIKKVIYVSTANAFGFGSKCDLGNEQKPIRPPFNKMPYAMSKLMGQEFVLSQSHEMDITVVNPTFMIGAYDSKPSSGRIILSCLRSRVVFCPPGGKNFVCVTDVSKGIINAMKYGKRGEAYLLANENLSFFEFYKKVRFHSKKSFLIVRLPKWVVLAVGYIGSALRTLRIKTPISKANTGALCINNFYSNSKAQTQIHLTFNSIDIGIQEALAWFSEKNWKNGGI
ncbi:NAD-dependent epimerase/dehydratase family protein [Aestuariivivens sediminis]|uniref:NAD-dependent epimerase/dehydratase family protein n=1 Tax=Aestuariivivens sediminis TaxID=2913557 RepID=UPI001F593061|nr:NAD-dependent epimerase/dehydratase family protein [Aestuariivivens sediminis]